MRTACAVGFAVAVVALSSSAWATDICVSDTSTMGHIVFRKVKALKPGKAVTLNGIGVNMPATESFPISGTAIMTTGGTVKIGVLYHSMAPGVTFGGGQIASLTTDATLAGTGNGDTDGDYLPDFAITWASVDCATVTLP